MNQKTQTTSHPSNSNDICETERNRENKNTAHSEENKTDDRKEVKKDENEENNSNAAVEFKNNENGLKSQLYQGLLFIEEIRNIKSGSSSEHFITYEGFWNECQESTQISVGMVFNYLKVQTI
jgi:hypothetical protein